jgi:hypothetical protein
MKLDTGFSNSFSPISTPTSSFDYTLNEGGFGGWNPATVNPFFDGTRSRDPGNAVTTSGGSFGGLGSGSSSVDPQIAAANGLRPTTQYGGSNWTPTFQTNLGGYNPSQYATVETANDLAGRINSGLGLGGNVIQTHSSGPIQPPPQQMIDLGGDSPLNAGLLAERYKKYDQATADAMTRAELALQGPKPAMNEDMQGGAFGSYSQFAPSPGGSLNLGGGQNIGQFVGENKPWADHLASSGVVRQPAAAPDTPALGSFTPPPVPITPPAAPVAPVAPAPPHTPAAPIAPPVAPPPTHTPVTPPTGNVSPTGSLPAPSPLPNNQQNLSQLMQLIQMLQGMRSNITSQARQPYANSRYYPNLPRSSGAAPVRQQQAQPQITQQQLLSLLLGF